MTRAEFDTWIEQHYTELLKVAKRKGAKEPEDTVQTAVMQMLAHGGYENTDKPWSWAVLYVRGDVATKRRSAARLKPVVRDLKILHRSGTSHGWKRPAPRAE